MHASRLGQPRSMAHTDIRNGSRDQSTADLLRQLSEQTTTLVRQEIELAKLELTEKGKKAGIGAGMFGGAGALGFYALGAFTACLVLALATAVTGSFVALTPPFRLGA